jgi:hypothetical protein
MFVLYLIVRKVECARWFDLMYFVCDFSTEGQKERMAAISLRI